MTLENGAYIGSSDNSQALQLRYANTVTVNDSSVSGGNAGILSSSRGGRVIINNGRIEGRFGSAILINPYTYSSSNTVTSVKVNAKDSVLLGQYGLRVEQRGSIEAQLSNTQLQATDAAISVNRLNYNQNKTLKISAELTNGSHIIANDAFQAHAGTLDITLRDSLVDAASSAAVTSEGGRVDLYTERSSIKGDLIGGIRTGTSDGINVTLTDGSSLTGYAENVKTLVLEDSDWHLTANSSVSTLQNLSGNIIFGSPVDINAAGDYKVLTVDGNYTGGGILTMNTWFAGDSSNTDKLDIVGDSSGQTTIAIDNVGGGGELTSNGIKIVDVRGASQGVFNLYQRVIAGMYEYDLYKNDVDGGWYLQSSLFNPSTPDEKDIAPEYGTHLTNLSVAANIFMHSLHDRMGEPQFSDDLKNGNSLPGVWVKIAAGKAQYKTANGQMKSKIETTTLRMGADIAQWNLNGDDRFHVGLMGAFADSDVNTSSLYRAATNGGVSRDAIGSVKGYSAGTYATWYENSNSPSGLYLDSWFQYGWFSNKVQGAGQREERYDSKGWTASIETGYALLLQDKIDYQFMLEPQVQIAYNNYGADDYLDSNLTQINDSRAKGLVTRLGTRIYTRSAQATNVIQPFIEANWWYNDSAAKQTFSGVTMKDGLPKSRYEIKTGIQSHFGKGWQAWGYIGSQWGDNSYSSYQGSVGLKRVF